MSKMNKLIDESLSLLDDALRYYTYEFTIWDIDELLPVTEIIRSFDVPHLSEWFYKIGFNMLKTIEEADIAYSDKLKDDIEFQMFALRLNLNTDSREHCFASITNYITSLYQIIVEADDSTMSFQEFSEWYTEEYVEELCECNAIVSPPCDFCAGEENGHIENAYKEYLLNKGEGYYDSTCL